MPAKKKLLTRKQQQDMWAIYWTYKHGRETPAPSHEDWPFYRYAEYLLKTEQFVPFRAKI